MVSLFLIQKNVFALGNKNIALGRKHPCRYTGSVYDGSLVIGGSDNKGQFDFMKQISIGDYVFITDTVGNRFSYIVSDIEITNDISAENLFS